MRTLAVSVCVLAVALCLTALPAAASSTLFSNLGPPGDLYYCCEGWTISGTGTLGFSQSIAEQFQVTTSGNVSQIDAGVGWVTGTNAFNVILAADNNGQPGTALGSWSNLSSPQAFGGCCGLITISGISGIHLTTGTNYWLIVEPTSLGSTLWGAWNFSNSAFGQLDYSTDVGQSWLNGGFTNQSAFDILGGTGGVPEPASLFLLGTGLIGIGRMVRRKR